MYQKVSFMYRCVGEKHFYYYYHKSVCATVTRRPVSLESRTLQFTFPSHLIAFFFRTYSNDKMNSWKNSKT